METTKSEYEKGFEAGNKANWDYIKLLKKDIDKGLANEITLRNEITKIKNRHKKQIDDLEFEIFWLKRFNKEKA